MLSVSETSYDLIEACGRRREWGQDVSPVVPHSSGNRRKVVKKVLLNHFGILGHLGHFSDLLLMKISKYRITFEAFVRSPILKGPVCRTR